MASINLVAILGFLILFGIIALVSWVVLVQIKRKATARILWMTLIAFALLVALIQFGPIIGKAVGQEYLFTLPKALLAIETGKADIVPLTSDGKKLVGKRGPAESKLTDFLAERGWTYKEQMGAALIYEKGGERLVAISRFRKGYWWYNLDKAP